jgi:hypothetical protein
MQEAEQTMMKKWMEAILEEVMLLQHLQRQQIAAHQQVLDYEGLLPLQQMLALGTMTIHMWLLLQLLRVENVRLKRDKLKQQLKLLRLLIQLVELMMIKLLPLQPPILDHGPLTQTLLLLLQHVAPLLVPQVAAQRMPLLPLH